MADNITIEESHGTWVVRAGGAVIGESQRALILHEEGRGDVVYFPRGDVAMAFLDASDTRSRSPSKGEARYFSIRTEATSIPDAGWSYESPSDGLDAIAGHLAFEGDDVAVERV